MYCDCISDLLSIDKDYIKLVLTIKSILNTLSINDSIHNIPNKMKHKNNQTCIYFL